MSEGQAKEQRAAPSGIAGIALRMQPDRRLVALFRGGDDHAFEEVVRRYRPSLVAYAGAITEAHRADDVVQDSLASAFVALRGSEADMHLRAWLYRIVRNTALNDLRAHRRPHEQLDENYDGVEQPPQALERRETVAALLAGLRGLPGPQREALVKQELEGLSQDEIAAELRVSRGAVRQLVYRAREALRAGAGALVPLPLIRWLDRAGQGEIDPTTAGAAGAAGLSAGGGVAAALKGGTAIMAAAASVFAGAALHDHFSGKPATALDQAQAAQTDAADASGSSAATLSASGAGGSANVAGDARGAGSGSGGSGKASGAPGGSGPGAKAGPGGKTGPGGGPEGSGGGSGSGSSGPGSGGGGDSGPGGGEDPSGSSGSGDSGSSGSGDSGSIEFDSSGSDGGSDGSGGSERSGDSGGTSGSSD